MYFNYLSQSKKMSNIMIFTKVHTQVMKLSARKSRWFALAIGQPQGSHALTAVSEQGHSLGTVFPSNIESKSSERIQVVLV